ncbi:hypothetical protein BD414DRAFT_313558 [Trametes punicea]|nr:hypothetical protein BD414DRAFT_313558 [Trametes punicea]
MVQRPSKARYERHSDLEDSKQHESVGQPLTIWSEGDRTGWGAEGAMVCGRPAQQPLQYICHHLVAGVLSNPPLNDQYPTSRGRDHEPAMRLGMPLNRQVAATLTKRSSRTQMSKWTATSSQPSPPIARSDASSSATIVLRHQEFELSLRAQLANTELNANIPPCLSTLHLLFIGP